MVSGFFVGVRFGFFGVWEIDPAQGAFAFSGSLRVEIENADARQQIRLGQIRMLMAAEGAIHQPMAVLHIEGEAADETLLFVVRRDEVETILIFSVKHVAFPVCSRRAGWPIHMTEP